MKPLNSPKKASSKAPRWLGTGLLSALLLTTSAYGMSAQTEIQVTATTAPVTQMEWRTDLDATLTEAQKEDKLVLLRFTADWCAPCRVMDARVWPETKVQSALKEKYLIVKSDIDIQANIASARKYGVHAVPTLLVLDGEGKEIQRGGFMSAEALLKFLDAAATATDESEATASVNL